MSIRKISTKRIWKTTCLRIFKLPILKRYSIGPREETIKRPPEVMERLVAIKKKIKNTTVAKKERNTDLGSDGGNMMIFPIG